MPIFPIIQSILIGGEPAKKAAQRIGEFDYLIGQPLSVGGFVNQGSEQHFQLVNSGTKWFDLPVSQTITEALIKSPDANAVGIYTNAKHVLEQVREVIKYPQIKLITILAEDVPEKDAREMVFLSQVNNISILGSSSLGIVLPGQSRLGEIGGDWKNLQLCHLDQPGPVGIITKSGGMSGELMWVVSQHTPGISAVVQIGGDAFPATDFVWWLEKFAADPQTKFVVMAGEAGGDLEERAAEWYKAYNSRITNNQQLTTNRFQLVCVISGLFLEQMPKGQKFGHAGAKQEESGFGSARHKIEALSSVGALVVSFENLGQTLREVTSK